MHERQTLFVEFIEEVLPRDFFKVRIFRIERIWKLNADDARILATACALHAGWDAAPFLGPPSDFIVIGCRFRRI